MLEALWTTTLGEPRQTCGGPGAQGLSSLRGNFREWEPETSGDLSARVCKCVYVCVQGVITMRRLLDSQEHCVKS